ncbi:MAG: hypothetical protein SPG64_02395 [Candidatus Enteromonas sp.]|nr:hypothetical protein [Candidatus Enteromonas sp.]
MSHLERIHTIWKEKNLGFIFSVIGSLTMGTISLSGVLKSYSPFTLWYMIFCYLLALFKIGLRILQKTNAGKWANLYGSLSLFLLGIPLVFAAVFTFLYRSTPTYPFYWMIYAYALYGTIKMVTAIVSLTKARKSIDPFQRVAAYFSFTGALYTLEMMEFALLTTFGNGESLSHINVAVQGLALLSISLTMSVLLMVRFIKDKTSPTPKE